MKKIIKLVGMTFSCREFPQLRENNPVGEITFVRNTKFDKPEFPEAKGIMVMSEGDHGIRIGWVANKSEEQAEINAMIDTAGDKMIGAIVECDYSGSKPWCRVEYSAGIASDKETGKKHESKVLTDKDTDSHHFAFYEKDGKQYERLSNIAGRIQIEEDTSQFDDWKLRTFNSLLELNAYMDAAAKVGTTMHSSNECACKLGIIDQVTRNMVIDKIPQDKFDTLPQGFWNFLGKECKGMKMLNTETTVYDGDNMIAGTYDLFAEQDGKKIVIDWKNSVKVRPDHLLKTAWYAYQAGADEAWVVAWRSHNKCHYQLKKVIGLSALTFAYETICAAAAGVRSARSFFKAMKG